MKHTLGQLHLRDGAFEGEVHICAPGKTIAVCDALPPEICDANAKRLVACWNACEGMNDPAATIDDLREVARVAEINAKMVIELEAANADLLKAATWAFNLLDSLNIYKSHPGIVSRALNPRGRDLWDTHKAAIALTKPEKV